MVNDELALLNIPNARHGIAHASAHAHTAKVQSLPTPCLQRD